MTKFFKFLTAVLITANSFADTPPSANSVLKGGTDGTKIGNIADALKVDVTNSLTATAYQGGTWSVTGNLGRTWTLTNTDIVTAVQSGVWNINLPTNASTASAQATGNASLSSIDSKITTTVNGIKVDATGITIPAGISTAANQVTGNSSLQNIDTNTAAGAKESGGHLASVDTKLVTTLNGIKVDGSAVTQPISASTLPLPSGAATAARQDTGNASLASISAGLSGLAIESGHIASIDAKTPALGQALESGSSPVVLPSSQISALTPLSTVTANLGTIGGAATASLQTAGNSSLSTIVTNTGLGAVESGGHLANIDTKTPSLGQALAASSVPVVLPAAQLSTLTPLSTVTVTQGTGSNLHVAVDSMPTTSVSGTVTANLGTLNGAATAANQSTTNASLSSIDTKTPSLVTGRVPVDGSGVTQPVSGTVSVSSIPSISGSVSVSNFPATQAVSIASMPTTPVSGTVTANLGTLNGAALDSSVTTMSAKLPAALDVSGYLKTHEQGTANVSVTSSVLPTGSATESTLSALNTKVTTTANGVKVDGSSVTQPVSGTVSALQSGAWSTGRTWSLSNTTDSVNVGNFPATQPVSGSVTVTQATGTNLHTVIDSGTVTASISGTPSVSVSNFPATQAVSAVSLPLPTGASTSALQSSMITALGTPMQQTGGSVTANAGTNLNTSALNLESTQSAMNAKFTTTANGLKVDGSAVIQPVTFNSTIDSSVANLAAAASYTTPWFDTQINGPELNFVVFSDQPLSYTITVSPDQVLQKVFDTSTIAANLPYQEQHFIAARYFKVTYTNTGAATTTSFYASTTQRYSGVAETIRLSDRNGNDFTIKTANSGPTSSDNAMITETRPNTQATYSATFTGAVTATAITDVFTISGSATKKIRIKEIYVAGTQTTAATERLLVIKRSTLNTAGTSTLITGVPFDSTQTAATAVVRSYTANPTLGTAVGTLISQMLLVDVAGASQFSFEKRLDSSFKDIVLNGVNDLIAINFNGGAMAGNSMNITVIWTEE